MNTETIFSFLSSSRDAVNAFIAKSLKQVADTGKTSNHLKLEIYQSEYELETREKYTGFEKLAELDLELRHKLMGVVAATEEKNFRAYRDFEPTDLSFRESLKQKAESLRGKTNILYLSGGVDSEVTALAFIDAGVVFNPIIFIWTDDQGNELNLHDVKYAFTFCEKHGLTPVVQHLDVETFWSGPEVLDYARKHNIGSPQILTYHKMIDEINKAIEAGSITLAKDPT